MRNYEKYYYNLLISQDPEDLALVTPPTLYKNFYNKNGSFSVAKFDGYIKAGIALTSFALIDKDLRSDKTSEELQETLLRKEEAENMLTLSKEDKETLVKNAIETTMPPSTTLTITTDTDIPVTCPNCNAISFAYNHTDNIYRCTNCHTSYTREELIEGLNGKEES